MKISKKWLEKFFDQSLPETHVLAETLTFHAFEIDGIERAAEDDILDVKVTPNRGHDCLSHRGIAKEISAILRVPLAHDPLAQVLQLTPTTKAISVSIENVSLCNRYIAGYIRNVQIGPSPQWLQERLQAMGQRPINNVVDATNFVMFNLGQPLHAFDAGKLEAKNETYSIVVRNAKQGETLIALDGKPYTLSDSMLVIADGNRAEAIGIAGVKGGMPAGITEATKDIIIESANFDGVSVRKTAAALKLRTDASARFEQILSPELAAYGMQLVVELLQKLASGEVVGFVDVYPKPQVQKIVSVSVEHVRQVLGANLHEEEIENVFVRLGLHYTKESGVYTVISPVERLDLVIPEDLIEEIARIVGYEKISATPLPPFLRHPEQNKNFYWSEKLRTSFTSQGFSEVYTSMFAEKGERVVLNKVDGVKPYLRDSLLPGLTEALEKNTHNKELLGLKEVRLFEIGIVWKNGKEHFMVGQVAEGKKATEMTLEAAAKDFPEPNSSPALPLSSAARYEAFSKYPYIVRDIALWTPVNTDIHTVENQIKKEAGVLCVKISLFDRFEKGDRVSLAFRLVFQSFDRTLQDSEAHASMETISAMLRRQGFEIR